LDDGKWVKKEFLLETVFFNRALLAKADLLENTQNHLSITILGHGIVVYKNEYARSCF